ncbi:DNA alkylation repair protein [Jiangella aurantiaca]|uniref:DNA alkylation repair protein n=1 Tax=Jiangella aurantiaca TaxID=2530373 RepID=A0A4R5AC73_9ACTN|nr:DNA alkylation repair protein [Jiangella aurantiaca]TDD69305.1 DNA alkylation repair protein [Jiangella aurantiaca]
MADIDAGEFERRLREHQDDEERRKFQRYFKDGGDEFIGVRMGTVFALAKEFIELPPPELERLLESDVHELRAGALSVMDKQARRKRTPADRRRELYELYLRRHDRIDNWDLVDLAAPYVVGGYLADKPRDVLYDLARSENRWKRRTAIAATAYFIRTGDVGDTFAIAELLLDDPEDLVHKATGGWLRAAGDKDPDRLRAFLEQHAAAMPRVMLRYAIEHLDPSQREHYRALR